MSFREITMQDVSDVLRRWQAGQSARRIAREMGLDRKTVGRYIDEAKAGGIVADIAVTEEVARAVGKGVQTRPLPPPSQQWRALARQAALRGKQVAVLEPAAYGGYKDVSASWTAGALAVGAGPAAATARGEVLAVPETLREVWAERVAIMVADGGMPPADAEHIAWEELQTQRATP